MEIYVYRARRLHNRTESYKTREPPHKKSKSSKYEYYLKHTRAVRRLHYENPSEPHSCVIRTKSSISLQNHF